MLGKHLRGVDDLTRRHLKPGRKGRGKKLWEDFIYLGEPEDEEKGPEDI